MSRDCQRPTVSFISVGEPSAEFLSAGLVLARESFQITPVEMIWSVFGDGTDERHVRGTDENAPMEDRDALVDIRPLDVSRGCPRRDAGSPFSSRPGPLVRAAGC